MSVGYDGNIEVRRALVRRSDIKASSEPPQEIPAAISGEKPISSALIAELSAQKTAALAVTLSNRADIALAVAVHALANSVFYPNADQSCIGVRVSRPDLERKLFAPERCKALKALSSAEKGWRKRLPADKDDLLAWCLAAPQETLLDLLAFVTATAVDVIEGKHKPSRCHESAALEQACALDMAS